MQRQPLAALALLATLALPLAAQDTVHVDTTRAQRLPPVVTVTRDVGRSPLDLPYAISATQPDSARPGQRHASLDEMLVGVPGVTLANRANPAQDPRVSVRGFGARSAFGVRSIRVLRDGMPLTLPDGQTPLDVLDLESVGRIEVVRGTASALYGNASGGVIDVRSAAAPQVPLSVQARTWGGSWYARHLVGALGGTAAGVEYQGDVARTTADNYRLYSRQRTTTGYARAATELAGTTFALQLLALDQPLAQNPGALTLAQFESDPRQADAASVTKRARKEVSQTQAGLSARRTVWSTGELSAQAYVGARSLYNPLTFAVVDVDRRLAGAGVRATAPLRTGALEHRLTMGADAQSQNDARLNWANCNGVATANASCPTVGVEKGTLRLDQREIVRSAGPYLRDEIEVGAVRASAGVRADVVRFELRDNYLADGDDSGDRTLHAVSPMAGVVVRLSPLASAYANLSSAFETPTTTELGNQADGSAGLNRDLAPQYSTTLEAGLRGFALGAVRYDVAAYNTAVRDELIPFEVAGGSGRTYYRNAGRTRRRGVEAELATSAGPVDVQLAWTWSHFRFVDFVAAGSDFAGDVIPGVPEHQGQGFVTWHGRHAFATLEGIAKTRVFANDANSASAKSFAIANARLGGTALLGRSWLSPVFGVANAFDARWVSSVAVNATGASLAATKFYEPGPGRSWYVGLTVGTGR